MGVQCEIKTEYEILERRIKMKKKGWTLANFVVVMIIVGLALALVLSIMTSRRDRPVSPSPPYEIRMMAPHSYSVTAFHKDPNDGYLPALNEGVEKIGGEVEFIVPYYTNYYELQTIWVRTKKH